MTDAQKPPADAVGSSEGLGLEPERLNLTPDQMRALLAQLAGELKDARELASSEGTRAVEYLRRARKAEADAARFRTLIRNTGNEWTLATPGADHKLQITLNCTGCERYLPDGAVDFPATIRAVLDDERRIQDSWAEKKA